MTVRLVKMERGPAKTARSAASLALTSSALNRADERATGFAIAVGPSCQSATGSWLVTIVLLYPAIAALWHPTRNGDLTPAEVTARSSRKVWWVCEKGPDHEWRTTVASG
jgi:hypothetical protein